MFRKVDEALECTIYGQTVYESVHVFSNVYLNPTGMEYEPDIMAS